MIGDFFAGLKTGLGRDPLIWLLLLLNAIAAWGAYGVWFKASAEDVQREWRQLRAIMASGSESGGAQ